MKNFDLSYLPYNLKKEQLDALEFCYNRETAIMSLGTGVGKTITSCCLVKQLLQETSNSIAVFIIPSKAIKAFKKELGVCNLSYHLWESDNMQNTPGARILLITHTALGKYVDKIKQICSRYNCIGVVDEIHNFSVNYDTDPYTINKRTQSLLDIRPIFKRFYALTATTVRNDAMSLYTMSNIVRPQYFGSPTQFQNKFCELDKQFYKIKTRWGTVKTIVKTKIKGFKDSPLFEKMKDDLIIFRQLSYNIEFNDIDIPLDNGLWEKYKAIGTGQVELLTKDNRKAKGMTEYSLRLIELQRLTDNCSSIFKSSDNLTNKEETLIRLIKQLFSEGHIPLVYCFYLDTIDRIQSVIADNIRVDGIYTITGQVPKKERAEIEDKIAPRTVTIINRAGTESINLQKADTIIYYNIPWSIDEYYQSLGRITRNDTKFEKQYVYFLQYEGTVDNYRAFIIKNRSSLVEQVQGEQLDSSDGINLSDKDNKELKNILLWCCKRNEPVTKQEVLDRIGK